MTRIRLLEPDEMDSDIQEMIRQVQTLTGDDTGLRVLAHCPQMLRSLVEFYWPLQTQGLLGRKLIEMVRLTIAQINKCPNCLATRYQDSFAEGLTEQLIEQLPLAEQSSAFSQREKTAIAFARKMATDHWSVGDAEFMALHAHFNEQEIVELNILIAMFIGLGRMFAVIEAINPVCELPNSAAVAKAG